LNEVLAVQRELPGVFRSHLILAPLAPGFAGKRRIATMGGSSSKVTEQFKSPGHATIKIYCEVGRLKNYSRLQIEGRSLAGQQGRLHDNDSSVARTAQAMHSVAD